MKDVEIEQLPTLDDYKMVVSFKDPETKLRGFIAIHNENLGPAVGGTRMFPYENEKTALIDALRLSRAMTYKCALAGVPHGGGKAVIIGNPDHDKNEPLIRAYARVIKKLNGRFITGEDVGLTEDDVQIMLEESDFFIGRRGIAGDPSPYAALSTYHSIITAVQEKLGLSSLKGLTIAVKGVGKVGSELVRLVKQDGARVIIADIRESAIAKIKAELPDLEVVPVETIHSLAVDIFSPCALGNDINEKNYKEVKAKIVCGGANNQLSSAEISDELFKHDILFVPDYVANAGGLINVVDELESNGYDHNRVLRRVENVKNTLSTILFLSKKKHLSPSRIADQLGEEIFHKQTAKAK
jgi:leucine dehydrogenase